MLSLAGRARFASLLAVACALLITGAAAGAAGSALILGVANDSGTSQTTLANAGLGAAFTLKTTNVSTNATGIFGWTSNTGANATKGVYGKADGPNSYGVFGRQGGDAGTGAAVVAEGNNNDGVVATSTGATAVDASGPNSAIIATSTGCTGFICFGGNGVTATGSGIFSAGVSASGFYGVYGSGSYGTFGSADAVGEIGAYGSNGAGTGVYGAGEGAVTIPGCGTSGSPSWSCSGGRFSGNNGVVAVTGSSGGVAVIAQNTAGVGSLGLYVYGSDALIGGNLTVSGTCTGCALAFIAENGGASALRQGDAVTLVGSKASPLGDGVVLIVRAAKGGDTVLGIMDAALEPSAETVTMPASSTTTTVPGVGERTVTSKKHTEKAQARTFQVSGTSSAKGAFLRVVASGIVQIAAADAGSAAIKAGDALTLDANGKFSKKGDKDRTIGFALKGLNAGAGKISILLTGN
jgi:hypothetical protein